jgi:hypothetical protein
VASVITTRFIAMPRMPDRNTVSARRAALHQAIDLSRGAVADAALAAERHPGVAAEEALTVAQRELDSARRGLERFELAQEAAAREATAHEVEEKTERVGSMTTELEAVQARLMATGPAIEQALADLAGPFAQFIADLAQARQLTTGIVRLKGGSAAVARCIGTKSMDGHSEAGAALGMAIVRSGLGLSGPGLDPLVWVSPPTRGVSVEPMATALARVHRLRLDAIAQAGAPAPVPAVSEEEGVAA